MQGFLVYGWREVLARIFAGCDAKYAVTPEWLVNPDTGRRLKLDCLYPEIGVAVRFVGLEGTAASVARATKRWPQKTPVRTSGRQLPGTWHRAFEHRP